MGVAMPKHSYPALSRFIKINIYHRAIKAKSVENMFRKCLETSSVQNLKKTGFGVENFIFLV